MPTGQVDRDAPPQPAGARGESRVAAALTGGMRPQREMWVRIGLLAAWIAAALFLAVHHVHWRDEVRAFSIALQGDTFAEFWRAVQGEGHPLIWYLLLRGAHELFGVREVLPAVGLLVGFAAMAVFALRAPFRPAILALVMFGGLALYEYSVIARNYGIGMLLLFLIAWAWPHKRDRGVWLGILLFLLCNTSVAATFFAAGFVGLWLLEIMGEEGLRWHPKYRTWLVNAALAVLGAAVAFVTVYPPVHDAAAIDHPGGLGIVTILHALVSPGEAFLLLAPPSLVDFGPTEALVALLMIGSVVGLARAPAALAAAAAAMVMFQLLDQLVYGGSYRHQGLFLMFLVALYWIAARGHGGRWPAAVRERGTALATLPRIGAAMFVLLLALQFAHSARYVAAVANGVPYSRAKDLAAVLEREGLSDAVVLADSDIMLEPLPYYSDARLFLMRDQRFHRVVRFTRNAWLDFTLDDLLGEARRLSRETGRPVVIVTQYRLFPDAPPRRLRQPFVGLYTVEPDQIGRFLSSTRRIARFAPAITDETYDAYVLENGAGS